MTYAVECSEVDFVIVHSVVVDSVIVRDFVVVCLVVRLVVDASPVW